MMDKETKDVIDSAQKAHDLTKSQDWQWAKEKLLSLVADISSIDNVNPNADNLVIDIAAKQLAVKTVMTWIKEVEAEASGYEHAQFVDEEEVVRRFD